MIRHLHDLAALEKVIVAGQTSFFTTAQNSLEQDQVRRGGGVMKNMSVQDRMDKAFILLTKDKLYRKEYDKFVMDMSYADDDDKIDFDGACTALSRLINIFL